MSTLYFFGFVFLFLISNFLFKKILYLNVKIPIEILSAGLAVGVCYLIIKFFCEKKMKQIDFFYSDISKHHKKLKKIIESFDSISSNARLFKDSFLKEGDVDKSQQYERCEYYSKFYIHHLSKIILDLGNEHSFECFYSQKKEEDKKRKEIFQRKFEEHTFNKKS